MPCVLKAQSKDQDVGCTYLVNSGKSSKNKVDFCNNNNKKVSLVIFYPFIHLSIEGRGTAGVNPNLHPGPGASPSQGQHSDKQ